MGRVITIVGRPKTGKTVSACTFPKPLLLLDFDRGFESVITAKDKEGKLVVPDWREITVVEFYKKLQANLSFKSYQPTRGGSGIPKGTPEYTAGAQDVITRYNSLMKELFDKGTFVEGCIEAGPFQTLVIDPLTTMFRIWKDNVLVINDVMELRWGDYLTMEGVLFNQFIPNLKALSDIIPYIVLLDHEDADISEKGDVINEFPIGPSKNMGKNLSEGLDELWRIEVVNDEYRWRTRKHGLFIGAGSRLSLPDPIKPATFQELQKHLPKEVV